ncbi:hypothetical protein CYMTET_19843 [Cymbomonas tetramitiformis]|uniref:Intradiol ring-cleavage dioxygenases domain-containing protein n=1 Tax=Cymbomonas tetramitiformis TaxID=36881 RepID=A0AAE0G5V1_9CHLO|nr:hypothetical protein CYMTET_19843 [Cymbomonas tetramitiformis]
MHFCAATDALPWHGEGCIATPRDMEGPFFQEGVPVKENVVCSSDNSTSLNTTRYNISGTVYSSFQGCAHTLAGTILHVWQTNGAGVYNPHDDLSSHWCRATLITDADGAYWFESEAPASYEGRPIRHIHFKLEATGHGNFPTQLYFSDDPLSEGRSATQRAVLIDAGQAANGAPLKSGFFDIVLQAEAGWEPPNSSEDLDDPVFTPQSSFPTTSADSIPSGTTLLPTSSPTTSSPPSSSSPTLSLTPSPSTLSRATIFPTPAGSSTAPTDTEGAQAAVSADEGIATSASSLCGALFLALVLNFVL